ncbi:hypothetical protein AMELA_G00141550 [Ameiurus melas]|uniref:Fibronectin type-III domain-containing protein n=1 Tax=Ameiurus melas TaxID=219545 RepID=A0A7J6AMV8_AMEME|nr:hypothetical protein AMELA_G00141550 [Ameiurus melas]
MKTVGLLVFLVAMFADKGATCSVSSPQCYKSTTKPYDDFLCEWGDQDHSPDAIYTIFMQTSSVNDSSYANQFVAEKQMYKFLPVEYLITTQLLDIWVHRQVFNVTCSSPTISVLLHNSVKYSSPDIQKKIRSAEKLILSWPRVNDNKGAIHEIRWKKINDSWQNKTFQTEDRKETEDGISDSYTLQLQEHTAYQVQIRRKAKQSLLWSDWSQTADIPIEIQQPVVRWGEKKYAEYGTREITLKWNKPPPEASSGGVSYTLTVNLPCEKTKRITIKNNTFKIAATYSEARVSIVAINNVGSSPAQEIIIPPVEHLKYCHNESHIESLPKRYCLEWYKLVDGETRPVEVNISWSNTLDDIKKGMEKFVRYYYFLHTGRKLKRRIKVTCPVYSTEGAPISHPKNVTVLNITHDSAVLWWRPIPVQEQHGFLMHYLIWISREGHTDTDYHQVPANETSFLLRNLDEASSYTLSIAGRTIIGAGPNSTRTFFTLSSPSTDNGLKMVILILCAVVLLFSIALSIAFRRLRSKLLPIIPSPVISVVALPHLDNQNMKTMTEEVDNVILLCRADQDKHGRSPKQKHGNSLQYYDVSVDEDEEDEGEEDDEETHFTGLICSDKPSAFPNPNYKGQLLQYPESLEIADKEQMESCEVSTPSYKNGLFFENRGLDNEGISVQS